MKLEYQKIDFTHIDFAKITALNLDLFPQNELVAPINLSNNIYANDENLSIFSFYNDKEFVGYAAIYSYENISYLAFLAVCAKYQGRGFGGLILEILKSNFNSSIILLISGKILNEFLICSTSRAFNDPQITFPHNLSKSYTSYKASRSCSLKIKLLFNASI